VRRLASILGVDPPRWTLPVGLVASLPSAWTGVHRESTRFLAEDRYDTRDGDAHAAAMGLVHPPLDRALARWVEHLVSTRFLSLPRAEPGRFLDGAFVVGDPRTSDVVMLHGIPFDGEAMAPLARAIGGTSARIDLPGLGRSAPGASIDRVLADRRRPVVLVGHSLGAAVAVRWAAENPDRVAGLVLVAPAFLAKPASWTLRFSPIVARVLGGLDAAELERRFLAERATGATLAATRSAIGALARAGAPRRYADALADAIGSRASALTAYANVRARSVRTLVVHAAVETPIEDVRGATLVRIEGAGHNPHLTHTGEVAEAVRAFLARALRSESARA
jgi:pimeloyl-ACP methyl ester carboxylesterase